MGWCHTYFFIISFFFFQFSPFCVLYLWSVGSASLACITTVGSYIVDSTKCQCFVISIQIMLSYIYMYIYWNFFFFSLMLGTDPIQVGVRAPPWFCRLFFFFVSSFVSLHSLFLGLAFYPASRWVLGALLLKVLGCQGQGSDIYVYIYMVLYRYMGIYQ